MYPLKFNPVYKQMLWGGNKLRTLYSRNIPGDNTGESWDLSAHKTGMSVVANGEFTGMPLAELLEQFGQEIYGSKQYGREFPLLVKIIDANDNLSVQVHPNDDNADRSKGESGKTEAWYVLAAKPGAKLIYGLREGTTKEQFAALVASGEVGQVLREVPVKVGDLISVPAGVVHALTSGVVVAEVQQSSDTTYRIYDYNRVGQDGQKRELHVDAALRVTDFGVQPDEDFAARRVTTPYFSLEEIDINGNIAQLTNDGFIIYIVLSGNGAISWQIEGGMRSLALGAGETVLVPASLVEVQISGNMKILVAR